MNSDEVIKIDVEAVIRERLPKYRRWIPSPVIRLVERIIHQRDLNWLLEHNAGAKGADFCRGVLTDLNVNYKISGEERMPAASDSRVTYVCNHPLGALDGIAIIDMISKRHPGKQVKFVVNDLLTAIKPLDNVFIPVNTHGGQSRGATDTLQEAFESDSPVVVFPAGLVSRLQNGVIRDLAWRKMFVNKCIEYQRDVIPLFFNGRNSGFFYNFAKFRTRLGLKFNYEMILLPREVFRSRDARFTVTVGQRIPWQSLTGGTRAARQAAAIRDTVYSLSDDSL